MFCKKYTKYWRTKHPTATIGYKYTIIALDSLFHCYYSGIIDDGSIGFAISNTFDCYSLIYISDDSTLFSSVVATIALLSMIVAEDYGQSENNISDIYTISTVKS